MKKKPIPEPVDFYEDFELESVSLQDLLNEIDLDVDEEEGYQEFYYPPGKPLKFE